MTLIADGGSTKCDWILLDSTGEVLVKTRTKGLNPAVVPYEELVSRISENADLAGIFETVEVLDPRSLAVYGTTCTQEQKTSQIDWVGPTFDNTLGKTRK